MLQMVDVVCTEKASQIIKSYLMLFYLFKVVVPYHLHYGAIEALNR